MKLRLIAFLVSVFLVSACKENADLLQFEANQAYTYFSYPNKQGVIEPKYLDSVFYSFALDEDAYIPEKVIKIPVNMAGMAAAVDRPYKLRISSESDFNSSIVHMSDPIIKAGKFSDTLTITIRRDVELSSKEMTMIFELQENEHFSLGPKVNWKMKVVFSDILVQPPWWRIWQAYLGPFQKEVFQKWKQIYYLGADPTPEIYNNIPPPYYYWNRMPGFVSATSVPITIMYMKKLKKYFDENEVYPDGDRTKPRILLP